MRRALLVLLACFLWLPGGVAAQPFAPGDADALPVEQVILYKSGVGYVEHAGTVRGDRAVRLRFPVEEMDDVLKSLLIEDASGQVRVVSYPSKEPLARALRSYAVDLSETPSLGAILNQLRGARVTVRFSAGEDVPVERAAGTIVSVEEQRARVEGAAVEVWRLNLLSASGALRSMRLDRVREIELDDPALEEELRRALGALAGQRGEDLRTVRIRFEGSGVRRVRLGYVTEAPVWKTSYRLLLPEKETAREATLQGWAIVENPTDADWTGVEVALVSGRPVSFVAPLYEPRYVDRPVIEPQGFRAPRPQRYEGGVEERGSSSIQFSAAGSEGVRGLVRDAQSGEPIPGANVAVADLGRGTATDADGRFRIRDLPEGEHVLQVSFVGFETARERFRLRSGRGVQAQVRLRSAASELEEVVVTGYGRQSERRVAAAPTAPSAQPDVIDPTVGVEAVAAAETVGEVFRYALGQVDLERQRSAMLPVLTHSLQARRVSIYDASVLQAHPLRGVRVENMTGLNLAAGPATVLDAGAYAGDARLPYLPPGETGLLSYAIDLDVQVQTAPGGPTENMLETGTITDGVLRLERRQRFEQTYRIENNASADRRLILVHPRRPGAVLEGTPAPLETTSQDYRFDLAVEAGETTSFVVRQAVPRGEMIRLLSADEDRLAALARADALPRDVRRALGRAAELREEAAEAERAAERLEQRLQVFTQEQERVRSNLQAVEKGTAYYQRLLAKLETQEDEIEALRERLDEARAERRTARERLRNYLRTLDIT